MEERGTRAPTTPARRTCGGCTACCTVMAIRSLEKRAGTPCIHAGPAGCGIYDIRPDACAGFVCLWLRDEKGILDEAHRPDRIGVVLTDDRESIDGSLSIAARELFTGAAARPEAAAMVEHLRQFVRVNVIPPRHATPAVLTVGGQAPVDRPAARADRRDATNVYAAAASGGDAPASRSDR